jgi:hypothetical protein
MQFSSMFKSGVDNRRNDGLHTPTGILSYVAIEFSAYATQMALHGACIGLDDWSHILVCSHPFFHRVSQIAMHGARIVATGRQAFTVSSCCDRSM